MSTLLNNTSNTIFRMSSIEGQYLDEVGEQYNSHYYCLIETYVDYAVIAARLWGNDFMDVHAMRDVIHGMSHEITLALRRITEVNDEMLDYIRPDDDTLVMFQQELRPIFKVIDAWTEMMDYMPHSLGDGSAE